MLVQNTPNFKDKIVTLKLITGEEIIARATYHDSLTKVISVKNPLSMVMIPNEDNNQGMVAFAPWMLSIGDDESVDIEPRSYIVVAVARPDAAEQYSRAVGEAPDVIVSQPKSAPQVINGARKGGRGR